MHITQALVLVTGYFSVYTWVSVVGCGLSLLRLLPSSSLTRQALKLLTPVWELTNVFLILGMVGFISLFSHGWREVSQASSASLTFGLIALALRAVLITYINVRRSKTGVTPLNVVLAMVSFALPLIFAETGIRLLTGAGFWQTAVGWAMEASLLLGMIALSVSFVYYEVGLTPHGRLRSLSRTLNVVFCFVTVVILQQLVISHEPHLLHAAMVYLMLIAAFILLWQLGLSYSARDRYMWWYLSFVAVAGPVLWGLANRPYLLYPSVYASSAYTSNGHGFDAIISLSIGFPIMVAGLVLLAWMILNRRKA